LQNTSPLFSVIIPVFNREILLPRAIESVLNQSFKDFEIIVIDDGSTDKSAQVAQSYGVRVVKRKNGGVAAARNLGIKLSKGNIIAFLDSDDEWKKDKLKIQYEFFRQNPSYKIHQTDEIWIRDGKFLNKKKIHQKKEGYIFENSCELCLISPSAVAIKRELFDEVGLFDESLRVCEDYDLWLRITKKYPVGFSKDRAVIKYGGHSDQLSKSETAMDRFRIKALLKHKDMPYALKVAKKKCKIVLKGAYKHNNKEFIAEFEPILKEIDESLDSMHG